MLYVVLKVGNWEWLLLFLYAKDFPIGNISSLCKCLTTTWDIFHRSVSRRVIASGVFIRRPASQRLFRYKRWTAGRICAVDTHDTYDIKATILLSNFPVLMIKNSISIGVQHVRYFLYFCWGVPSVLESRPHCREPATKFNFIGLGPQIEYM